MPREPAGFCEHEHTADWELEAWAPDLPGLLEQAARGMYALSGTQLEPAPRLQRHISLTADDPESLVVTFLQELLYLGETEGIGFDEYNIQVQDHQLNARLAGAPIRSQLKEIKAVTYHNIKVVKNEDGVQVRIVFDI